MTNRFKSDFSGFSDDKSDISNTEIGHFNEP